MIPRDWRPSQDILDDDVMSDSIHKEMEDALTRAINAVKSKFGTVSLPAEKIDWESAKHCLPQGTIAGVPVVYVERLPNAPIS